MRERWFDKTREWHRCFAWHPVLIEDQKYEEIVVPRHWLWLENYERKSTDWKYSVWGWGMKKVAKDWQTRTYRGAKSLRELVYE